LTGAKISCNNNIKSFRLFNNEEILSLFGLLEVVDRKELKNYIGKQLADD
jgi:hypothetical protein